MSYSIETDKKWQAKWAETELYKFNPDAEGKKLYCLEMFSYPSGANLHLGHWYNYSLTDSWARFKHMQGYNLFHPMGFDSFGLVLEGPTIMTPSIRAWPPIVVFFTATGQLLDFFLDFFAALAGTSGISCTRSISSAGAS